MAAMVVMTITLVILFVTVVASVALNNTAESMRDAIDITIFVRPGTAEEILQQMSERIALDSNIKSVVYSTSEDEYKKMLEENADSQDLMEILGDDEMGERTLASTFSTLRIKVYDADNLASIKEIVDNDELFVQYVSTKMSPTYETEQPSIAAIMSWARIARTGGIVLAAVFLLVSILIIFSTIRMAIFSRREEIYMMKLVGAEKSFIRGPFLVEAEICGIIAGVIAATISYAGFMYLSPKLADKGIDVGAINSVLESNQLVLVYLAFVLLGIIISRVSARLAISKYLHKA